MPVKKTLSGSQQQKTQKPKLKIYEVEKAQLLKDGLPISAYAIAPSEFDVLTWQLPHHTILVSKPGALEGSVDWVMMERCVLQLSRQGIDGRRIAADPSTIIHAACHLAGHYNKCGRPLPLALCVLVTNEI